MPLTRRSLLAAFGGVLLTTPAGCTLFDDEPPAPRASAAPPPPDPLLPLLSAEIALLAQYDATVARHPQLAASIGPVRANHAAHTDALRAIVRNPPPSPSPSAAPSTPPLPSGVPATPAAAITTLRSAELAGAGRLSAACLTAPLERAALLGSIAACESTHLVVLR